MGVTGMIGVVSFHDGWNVGELLGYALPVLRHRVVMTYGSRYLIGLMD